MEKSDFVKILLLVKRSSEIFIYFLLLLCGTNIAFAQDLWTPIKLLKGGSTDKVLITTKDVIFAKGGALVRSTDLGLSWESISIPDSYYGLVSEIDGSILNYGYSGLYGSSDNGSTWTKLINDIIRCATTDSSGNIYCLNDSSIIYKSADQGANWDIDSVGSGMKTFLIYSVNNNTLVAASQSDKNYIHYSTDKGTTWHKSNLPIKNSGVSSFISNSKGYIFAAVGDSGIIRSSDNGVTWELMNVPAFVTSLTVDTSGTIYSSPGSKIFRSTDNGNTWDTCTSYRGHYNYSIGVTSNGDVYSGSENGLVHSSDQGATWERMNYFNITATIYTNRGNSFFIQTDTLFYTSDAGNTWSSYGGGFSKLIFLTDDNIIALGSRIYRSTNYGVSWQAIWESTYHSVLSVCANSNGIVIANTYYFGPGWIPNQYRGVITSTDFGITWKFYPNNDLPDVIESSPSDDFYGLTGNKFYHSSDGLNWNEIKTDITASINKISFNKNAEPVILTSQGAFTLIINGDSAKAVSLIDKQILSICFTNSGRIFATTKTDVIYSDDNGTTWQTYSQGLPPAGIRSIIVDKHGNGIVSTYSGLYKNTEKLTDVSSPYLENSKNDLLIQSYPNPFNSTTTIRYYISKTTKVTLAVYNILGERVATLVNKEEPSGEHNVQFDASNLASGVYIYRLQTEELTQSKKIILLK